MRRTTFEPEHAAFRESVRRFVSEELTPHHLRWEEEGITPRSIFTKAAEMGMLSMGVPEAHGGLGVDDFRFNQVVCEEIAHAGVAGSGLGITLHNDVCLPYFLEYCTPEQQDRWLPGIADGSLVTAVAMTEPGTGSDLAAMSTTAIHDGDHFVVNGSKTFITSGINADLIITAVKTDPKEKHRGISLLVLERGMDGLERGRNLEKLGMHAQDTAELFFNDVHVPAENLLGEEGMGFKIFMKTLDGGRISIGALGLGLAQAALDESIAYSETRSTFGKPISGHQAIQHKIATMATEIEAARHLCYQAAIMKDKGLKFSKESAMAKLYASEVAMRATTEAIQIHGGYGYMREYPVERFYRDAKILTIGEGTDEVQQMVIARALGA